MKKMIVKIPIKSVERVVSTLAPLGLKVAVPEYDELERVWTTEITVNNKQEEDFVNEMILYWNSLEVA